MRYLKSRKIYLFLGVNVSEKWNTDNVITTEASVENKGMKGLKVGVETALSPVTEYVFVFYFLSFKFLGLYMSWRVRA